MYLYLQKTRRQCTGCGACVNICPVDAIDYIEDCPSDGSLVAKIRTDKCIGCNKCRDICPQINPPHNTNVTYPICHAVMASDEIRKMSSSGGAFTVLAEYILAQGGEVCSVAWNAEFEAEFIVISEKDRLAKLRRSKYVQARVGYIYREVKDKLEQGKNILFVGCPCQAAGLRSYLGKEYNNLCLVDIYCNYAPSPIVFRKYLHENFSVNEIENIDFRVKNQGWVCDIHSITLKNGDKAERRTGNDSFQKGFHSKLFMREVCENCNYAGFPRQGDFSIGDFWYINHFHPGLDDLKGTSCVLVNNEKARHIFAGLQDKWKLCRTVGLDCMQYNRTAVVIAHPARDRFYELLKTHPFNESVEKALSGKYDAVVWGCWSEKNYGSELTYYALYRFLQSQEMDVLMVERPGNAAWKPYGKPVLFKENPYPGGTLSVLYPDKTAMRALNHVSDVFIVGSDQIWHSNLYRSFGEVGCLDFIFNSKKKIAFATSFGREYWSGDEAQTQEVRMYLQDFDYVSVREQSGVDICDKVFGVEAQNVLDPVFMCEPSVYVELAQRSNMKVPDHYIGAYILDIDESKKDFLERVQRRLGLPLNVISDAFDEAVFDKNSVADRPFTGASCEDWLKNIICSDWVVTDSFHGMCFAIIFRKPFIAITNRKRGVARFTELLKKFDLLERLVYEEDLTGELEESAYEPIDYKEAGEVLEKERTKTLAWFRRAIDTPKKPEVTRYDILLQNIIEGEWRLSSDIRDERGARQWDISIHQSRLNEIAGLLDGMNTRICELDKQIDVREADIHEQQAMKERESLQKINEEFGDALNDIHELHDQAVSQLREIAVLKEHIRGNEELIECLTEMFQDLQEQENRLERNWLIRWSRKLSTIKRKICRK